MEESTPRAMPATAWLLLILCVSSAVGVLQARTQPDNKGIYACSPYFWNIITACFTPGRTGRVLCNAGFITIDCGLSEETGYEQNTTKLWNAPDVGFTDTGTNHIISPE